MSEKQKCDICENDLVFQWSDTHGVGVCWNCGTPYTIYHYGEDKKRIEKSPEIALTGSGIDIAKRYWEETKHRVWPAVYDMGILPSRETSYSGASREDIGLFDKWYGEQPDLQQEGDDSG